RSPWRSLPAEGFWQPAMVSNRNSSLSDYIGINRRYVSLGIYYFAATRSKYLAVSIWKLRMRTPRHARFLFGFFVLKERHFSSTDQVRGRLWRGKSLPCTCRREGLRRGIHVYRPMPEA